MPDVLLLLIGAVFGFLSQWLLEVAKDRRANRRGPNVAIAKYEQDNAVFVALHNLGPDGLAEMDVAIHWEQVGVTQERALKRFFKVGQNVATASAGFSEYLAASERLLAADIPAWSDDGLINVTVSGLGQQSRRLYETRGQIAVRVGERL